jgi:hypothetical protein
MLESAAAPIESAIRGSALVVTHNLEKVQLSATVGYIEGSLSFVDNSRLVFFEFLRQTEDGVQREKYRYHFMDASDQLIFRYDNAAHHPEIVTFPDHKHLPTGLVESVALHFADMFVEIEAYVLGIK